MTFVSGSSLQSQLQRTAGRTGSDARDEFGNRYELKTVTTSNVTTGRDIGPEYLDRLRASYLICARGNNTQYGFSVDEIYLLSPEMMEDWIAKIETRIAADRGLVDSAITALTRMSFAGDLERLRRIGYRGFTLNNPKISWSYITSHGIKLEGEPSLHLRELVARHPILPRS
jgi:hypothetical protein